MSEPEAKRPRIILSPKILAGAIKTKQWDRVVNLTSHRKISDVINEAYAGLTPMQRFVRTGCFYAHHNSAVFDALVAVDGFDVDAHGPDGDCPVVEALKRQADLTFAALVERGARVDVVDREGTPALLCALRHLSGTDLSPFNDFAATDAEGRNVFHYARAPAQFRMLMQRVPHLMDAPDNHGMTPLLFGSTGGYPSEEGVMCAELFIEYGALLPANAHAYNALGVALKRIKAKYGSIDKARRTFCALGAHTKSAAKQG